MERSRAAWSNDILMQVTRHSTLLELRVVSRVARPWRDAARTAAQEALLDHQFSSKALLRFVCFSPPEQRVSRIMSFAADDLMLMDQASFRTVIEIQLALQHVRKRTPFPHRVSLGRVVDLLVGTAGPGLSTEHPLVRQALESMDVSRELLDLNVANEIPHFQRAWRRAPVDWVCIRNLLSIFLVPVLPWDLARVLSGAAS